MSHTDKDDPTWVRGLHANRRTAQHHPNCVNAFEHYRRWFTRHPERNRPCDLDNPHTHGWRDACSWWPEDRTGWRRHYGDFHMRERAHLGWYGPERAAVRDILRDIQRDYNANGYAENNDEDEIGWLPETEPITRHHRHGDWYGGWWD